MFLKILKARRLTLSQALVVYSRKVELISNRNIIKRSKKYTEFLSGSIKFDYTLFQVGVSSLSQIYQPLE